MGQQILWFISLGLTLVLSTLTACSTPVTLPTLSEDEQTEADIYAAVARYLYTSEPTDFPKIYLVEATDDWLNHPNRPQAPSIPQAPSRRLPESIQVTITAALDDLPAKVRWTEDFSEVPRDSWTGAVKGNGVIITLGNIHFQEDGTAFVRGSIYTGNLGAEGRIYIVERIGGAWQIVGDTGMAWMS